MDTDGEGTALSGTLEAIIASLRRLLDIDAAAFLVVDWDAGTITPAAAWFGSGDVERALLPLLRRRYDRERPGITEAAIEAGRPLLLERVEEWPAGARIRERVEADLGAEQAERTWDWYRRASAIACPVRAPDGRSLGVLVASTTPPLAPLDDESLRLVEPLADLAAVAVDRSQLLEATATRRRREAALNEAARTIAESLDLGTVYGRIVDRAIALTGGRRAHLTRWNEALGRLEPVANVGFSPEVAWRRFRRGEGMIGRVAERREPYRSRPQDREGFLHDVMESEGIGSFAHVPIQLGPRFFGVLSVGREAEDFGDAEFGQLQALARIAAAAIANATEHEHERRVARALARGFIPAEPGRLPGVELGSRYEPAGRQRTGGDLYGAWLTAHGAVAVLIGDASGRGLEVAALAATVRFFVEARSFDSRRPADVLRQAQLLLRGRLPDDGFVTAFLGLIEGDELRWCNAGHAPPLVLRAAGGEPVELRGSGLPLGVDDAAPLEGGSARLAPGDLVVAYTDGLSEARRGSELFGERELPRAVAEVRALGSPQALVDALYERALAWAGEIEDDVALLALRRAGG